jgi:hypothetical protein
MIFFLPKILIEILQFLQEVSAFGSLIPLSSFLFVFHVK